MLSKKYTHKSILINNEIIELTQTYKYLGLTLDSSLTFIKHLSNLINTLNYKIYLLNKIRPFLTRAASITLYKMMILPYLDYGDIVYSATNINQLNKLQRLQNYCLRICRLTGIELPA